MIIDGAEFTSEVVYFQEIPYVLLIYKNGNTCFRVDRRVTANRTTFKVRHVGNYTLSSGQFEYALSEASRFVNEMV